ncbi:hypothetical protein TYRP_023035 [Tyrophagus putrescentiae]|nr:hypothetical protein TYRP_023035 [Tyrophagus putrescentiae]
MSWDFSLKVLLGDCVSDEHGERSTGNSLVLESSNYSSHFGPALLGDTNLMRVVRATDAKPYITGKLILANASKFSSQFH